MQWSPLKLLPWRSCLLHPCQDLAGRWSRALPEAAENTGTSGRHCWDSEQDDEPLGQQGMQKIGHLGNEARLRGGTRAKQHRAQPTRHQQRVSHRHSSETSPDSSAGTQLRRSEITSGTGRDSKRLRFGGLSHGSIWPFYFQTINCIWLLQGSWLPHGGAGSTKTRDTATLAPKHPWKWAALTSKNVKLLGNQKKKKTHHVGGKKKRHRNIHLHTLYLVLYKFLSQLLKQMTVVKQIHACFYYFHSYHWISQVPINPSHIKEDFKQQVWEAEL